LKSCVFELRSPLHKNITINMALGCARSPFKEPRDILSLTLHQTRLLCD
jgi:hypothetical protein